MIWIFSSFSPRTIPAIAKSTDLALRTVCPYVSDFSSSFFSKNYPSQALQNFGLFLIINVFDILILGLVFGNAKLIERYAETSLVSEALRFEFHEFGLAQFKKFWLFGYGSGAFGIVYKLFYNSLSLSGEYIATHAHNDGIELMGEVGILGILILCLLSIIYFKKLVNNIRDDRVLARLFLISSLLLILFIQSFVDYSLHIPGISTLLAVILSVGLVNFRKANP